MDGFPEAAAVHLRIKYDQGEGQQSEEPLESHGGDGCSPSPYSGYQRRADDCLREGQQSAERLGRESEESDVHEVEILIHHEAGPYRIEELEDA